MKHNKQGCQTAALFVKLYVSRELIVCYAIEELQCGANLM